jgi:hypothetical protein
MDTTAVISLIVVGLAVIIPIVYSRIRSNREKKIAVASFRVMAHANYLNLSETEHWNHYAIGIDRGSSRLIYQNKNSQSEAVIIDLSRVRSVETRDVSRGVETKSGRVSVLDQLNLILMPKAKDTSLQP